MANLFDVDVDSGGRLTITTTDATGQIVRVAQQDQIKTLNPAGWVGSVGVEGTYQITNYHFSNDYEVSTNNGMVRIEDDLIYYTPSLIGNAGFLVNGTFCAVTVTSDEPFKPAITSPSYNDAGLPRTVVLTTSGFQDSNVNVTHTATHWQISTDVFFNTLVMDVTSTTDLTSIAATGLEWGTTYYARAQHIGTKP